MNSSEAYPFIARARNHCITFVKAAIVVVAWPSAGR